MASNVEIELEFSKAEYAQGKEFIIKSLPEQTSIKRTRSDEMYDEAQIASIALEVSKVAIPSVCALVALWLGKGKSLTIKAKGKSMALKNISEPAAKTLVSEFLREVERESR